MGISRTLILFLFGISHFPNAHGQLPQGSIGVGPIGAGAPITGGGQVPVGGGTAGGRNIDAGGGAQLYTGIGDNLMYGGWELIF